MDATVDYAVIAVVVALALVVFLFIARRVLRLALRLMLFGVFVFALLAAGAWGWWNGWFGATRPAPTERPASPRRSPPR